MKVGTDKYTNRILFLFLIVDLVFIGLHIVCRKTDLISDPLFLLTTDRGYSEVFQYIKIFWIVLLIGSAAIRARASLYLLWTIIFSYLLMDDLLMLHETIGGVIIGDKLKNIFPYLETISYDAGQVVYASLLGTMFIGIGIILYQFSKQYIKTTSTYLLILLFAFAFFSVIVDVVAAFFEKVYSMPVSGTSILEDGGELIVMSFIIYVVFSVHLHIYKYGAEFVQR